MTSPKAAAHEHTEGAGTLPHVHLGITVWGRGFSSSYPRTVMKVRKLMAFPGEGEMKNKIIIIKKNLKEQAHTKTCKLI